VGGVDNRAEIREFLATRRAKISPEQAGLPAGGGKRRVPAGFAQLPTQPTPPRR
jgi:hypothetical protein